MKLPKSNCARGSRTGLTLVEVVAGLALMGTLLVAVILGASSHLRQLRTVERKKAAIESLDKLLASWSHHGFYDQALPQCATLAGVHLIDVPVSLELPSEPDATSVRVVTWPLTLSSGLDLEVVRLEVLPSKNQPNAPPLTWIEVLRTPRPSVIRSQSAQ